MATTTQNSSAAAPGLFSILKRIKDAAESSQSGAAPSGQNSVPHLAEVLAQAAIGTKDADAFRDGLVMLCDAVRKIDASMKDGPLS